MADFEKELYKDIITQQKQKLKILQKIKALDNSTDDWENLNEEILDAAVETIINKKKEKVIKQRERIETDKINEIKNSIYEKQVLEFPSEIIDFGFLSLNIPTKGNEDSVALIFVMNNKENSTIIIEDMRGEILVEENIENCNAQFLLTNIHFNEIFAGVLCTNLDFHLFEFSTDKYIDARKPSENSPYFRVSKHSSVGLLTEVTKFQKLKGIKVEEDFKIEKASSYFVKGNKYFIFVDNNGRIINMRSDLVIKNLFRLETSKITAIRRHNLSILFSTKNNIGFLKLFEEISDQVF